MQESLKAPEGVQVRRSLSKVTCRIMQLTGAQSYRDNTQKQPERKGQAMPEKAQKKPLVCNHLPRLRFRSNMYSPIVADDHAGNADTSISQSLPKVQVGKSRRSGLVVFVGNKDSGVALGGNRSRSPSPQARTPSSPLSRFTFGKLSILAQRGVAFPGYFPLAPSPAHQRNVFGRQRPV